MRKRNTRRGRQARRRVVNVRGPLHGRNGRVGIALSILSTGLVCSLGANRANENLETPLSADPSETSNQDTAGESY